MDEADFNITRPNRLLKPGDLRKSAATLGPFNTGYFQQLNLRPSYQLQSENLFQPLQKSLSYANPQEPFHPAYTLTSEPNQNAYPFSSQDQSVFNRIDLWRRSDGELSCNRIFSRAPGGGLARSESNPSLLDGLSNSSSPESAYQSFNHQERYARTLPFQTTNSVSTQTKRSPFEEKFLFRESILLGCDIVTDLAQRVPALEQVQAYADCLRDKTLQSRAQNICSRMTVATTEDQVVTEYVKTFIKIADSWLDARNCFGMGDRCWGEVCSLTTRELSGNYVEWMHSSRQLLNSIVTGLENINKVYGRDMQGEKVIQPSIGPGGLWGYPPNPPCHCAPMPSRSMPAEIAQHVRATNVPMQDPPAWYHNQQQPLYPAGPPPPYNAGQKNENKNPEYLEPSSYDVPRKNITPSKKRSNIAKAKADAFNDAVLIDGGYIVALPNTGNRRDHFEAESEQYKPDDVKTEQDKSKQELFLSKLSNYSKNEQKKDEESDSASDGLREQPDGRGSSDGTCQQRQRASTAPPAPAFYGSNVWTHGNSKRRRALLPAQAARVQEIIHALAEFDFPICVKYPSRETESAHHPIAVENIASKAKNNSYETVEQFVHDCRRLFLHASVFCQKNKQEREDVSKLNSDFEQLLNERFENVQNWNYIVGDPKEVNLYPELKYSNARKKSKPPKSTQL